MKEWKYLIGSADDFIGAPGWATLKTKSNSYEFFLERAEKGGKYVSNIFPSEEKITSNNAPEADERIIAQRTESFGNAIDLEFCKANPDHPDCKCKDGQTFTDYVVDVLSDLKKMALESQLSNKYNRPCKGITLDVYDVLQAFAVTNPATQHAIKKLLCAGLRGHKDKMQDLTEALKSIERAIELEKE